MNLPKLLRQAGGELSTGNPRAADTLLKRILKKHPGQLDALNLAGLAAYQMGDLAHGRKLLEKVINQAPDRQSAHLNLGVILNSLGEYERAQHHYLTARTLSPADPTVYTNLGKNFLDQNKLDNALAELTRATQLAPDSWIAQHNLGTCLQRLSRFDEAFAAYQAALQLHDNPETISEMIAVLRGTNRFEEEFALAHAFLTSGELCDVSINAWETLFDAFDWQTIADTRPKIQSLMADPSSRAETLRTGLLLCNSLPEITHDKAYELHECWARALSNPADAPIHYPNPHRQRRLRIGYLSPDFREHSVGLFIRPVIAAHDREQFDIFCYANSACRDNTTGMIAAAASRFVTCDSMSDRELMKTIRDDELDILVDLAGHTRNTRVAVMNERLAPVQITYLGYPNTTGLDNVDYRISDPYVDCEYGTRYSERRLKLPESFLCFGAFDRVPRAEESPCTINRTVTFGSFNNVRKITPQAVACWAAILQQVPGSRLVIKSRRAATTITRCHIEAEFAKHGVKANRIEMRDVCATRAEHLNAYNDIDIALDTFPYNGTTTTCEALWMGVPVVTYTAEAHAQRVSYSILRNLKLTDLVTWAEDDYITCAVQLAQDVSRLNKLRRDIPSRLAQSILCDPLKFTRQLEATYVEALKQRCGESLPTALAG